MAAPLRGGLGHWGALPAVVGTGLVPHAAPGTGSPDSGSFQQGARGHCLPPRLVPSAWRWPRGTRAASRRGDRRLPRPEHPSLPRGRDANREDAGARARDHARGTLLRRGRGPRLAPEGELGAFGQKRAPTPVLTPASGCHRGEGLGGPSPGQGGPIEDGSPGVLPRDEGGWAALAAGEAAEPPLRVLGVGSHVAWDRP